MRHTLEVVCSLLTHMPVCYTSLSGNTPDSRTVHLIVRELEHAGFRNFVLITDRGCGSLDNLIERVRARQMLLTASRVDQEHILEHIDALGPFQRRPSNMEWIEDQGVHAAQYPLDMRIDTKSGKSGNVKGPQLNLHCSMDAATSDQEDLEQELTRMRKEIEALQESRAKLSEDDADRLRHFDITPTRTGRIKSYTENQEEIRKVGRTFGFFASTSFKYPVSARTALDSCNLHDEQEKCFTSMKTDLGCDVSRASTESTKFGRDFVTFVSLIPASYIMGVWKATDLHQMFSSSHVMVETMKGIQCVRHAGRAPLHTPFVGRQVAICDAFGLEIPKGCRPGSQELKDKARDRQRPRKQN